MSRRIGPRSADEDRAQPRPWAFPMTDATGPINGSPAVRPNHAGQGSNAVAPKPIGTRSAGPRNARELSVWVRTMKTPKPSHEVGSLKAKALRAAAKVLSERGVEKLNLRAIAVAGGIGAASMYHYFASKDDLLLNLAIQGFADLRADIMSLQSDDESPIRGGARAFFGFAQENPELFSLMFDERLMSRHESLRHAEHESFLAYEAAVVADHRIPAQHKSVAAFALWALGRGMAATMSSYPDGRPPDDVLEKLFAGAAYLVYHPE